MRVRAALWWLALAGAVVGARELDPAACGARFDVQRDKIIRTEESREMGARYLSELDVGARQECLRLCCETDSCDVFVYEEKSPGSCYLFNCGPPEDFRCKFTAHGNFSSGVLALSRRLAELQDQERLAHHEQELASLRGVTSSTSTTTTTSTPAPATAPHVQHQPDPPPGRCSRYQFECRRGGECIAVYNACDGVPQCADGSDEAPELGCPAPAPPAPSAPHPPQPAQQQPVQQQQPQPPQPQPQALPAPTPAPRAPVQPLKPMQVLGEGAEGAEGESEAGDLPERWPHRLAQAQPPHRYNEVGHGSHIFSHKGGLLQEGAPAPQYAPFEPPWTRRLWAQPQPGGEWGGAAGGWGEPDPRRAWPVPQPPPDPELPLYVPPKTMPEMPMVYSSQQQTLRDSPKKGFELERAPPRTEPPAPAPPPPDRREERPPVQPETTTKKKNLENTPHEPAVAVSHAAAAVAAAAAARPAAQLADEHDGLSEHPPAAILLLVLGVAMTAVLGAMVGCRARAARRRMRRGKSPFAHDADYLVNGMYL
ncbi:hypothetical protein ABMA28_001846 [Loxostege sticticalis]|uniref:MANSC domain-containing protein n=1 Tax=Loxostege sticticalis TaxID=481309 RepID=A0ABD0T048_LOXSC